MLASHGGKPTRRQPEATRHKAHSNASANPRAFVQSGFDEVRSRSARNSAPRTSQKPPDSQAAGRILRDRVAPLDDPRSIDQALRGDRFGEFWRYRDYRVVARIEDSEALIQVLRIGHRRDVYR